MDGLDEQETQPIFNTRGSAMREDRSRQFSSKLMTYLTCLGCAVGTGNIWRFPRVVANNSQKEGGLAFIVVWVLFLFLWSIPMLMIEYGMGRYTRKAVVGSIRELISEKASFLGLFIVMVSFMISCYYAVILGWCMYYFGYYIINELPSTLKESTHNFSNFAEDSRWPVLFTFIAIVMASLGVTRGLKVIEKVSFVLVLLLLGIIVMAFVASLCLPHASQGIKYLFTWDWDSLASIQTWIDALSQNAFDAGAGAGLMVSYASYLTDRDKIVKYSVAIPFMNNVVSLMCGTTVFACVFATLISSYGLTNNQDIVDLMMDSGPGNTGLTFIWFPLLFSTFNPVVGRIVACLFFLCASAAGLTSLMANIELFTQTCVNIFSDRSVEDTQENRCIGPRFFALLFVVLALCLMSLMSALDVRILDNQDFVWGFGLILNGLIFVSLVITYGPENFRQTVVNIFGIGGDWILPKFWNYMIMILLPVEALGILIAWAVDLVTTSSKDQPEWTEIGEKTFLTVLVEWLGLFLFIFIVSTILYRCCRDGVATRGVRPTTPLSNTSYSSFDSGRSSQSVKVAHVTGF